MALFLFLFLFCFVFVFTFFFFLIFIFFLGLLRTQPNKWEKNLKSDLGTAFYTTMNHQILCL